MYIFGKTIIPFAIDDILQTVKTWLIHPKYTKIKKLKKLQFAIKYLRFLPIYYSQGVKELFERGA